VSRIGCHLIDRGFCESGSNRSAKTSWMCPAPDLA